MISPACHRRQTRTYPLPAGRKGFTLLELVVVMGIISILAALAVAAVGSALGDSRERATQATITAIDSVLTPRLQQYQDVVLRRRGDSGLTSKAGEAFRDRYYNLRNAEASLVDQTTDGTEDERKLLARKRLFLSVFPQQFEDLCGFDGTAGASGSIDLLQLGMGTNDDPPTASAVRAAVEALGSAYLPGSHRPETESSELLYLMVTNEVLPGFPTLDPDRLESRVTVDTDGDGLLEFVDAWDEPLRFYAYTGSLLRPDTDADGTPNDAANITADSLQAAVVLMPQAVPSINGANVNTVVPAGEANNPLNRDPDQELTRWSFDTAGPSPLLGNYTLNGVGGAPGWPGPSNTASVPLVVSAGPDGVLGLGEPSADGPERFAQLTGTLDDILDNITSRQGGVQ